MQCSGHRTHNEMFGKIYSSTSRNFLLIGIVKKGLNGMKYFWFKAGYKVQGIKTSVGIEWNGSLDVMCRTMGATKAAANGEMLSRFQKWSSSPA